MKKEEYTYMYRVEHNLWWYKGLREVLKSCLHKYSRPRVTILDAGCGTGMNMLYLQSLGYQMSGIDVSADALRFAKKRRLMNLKVASITHIPFLDSSFDIVLNMDVIGLLDEVSVRKAVREFHRVLKPGGRLLLHCAALEWLKSQHDIASHVKRRYTPQGLKKLFESKKWTIEKLSFRMFFLFIPLTLVKILRKFISRPDSPGDLYLPPSVLNILLTVIQKCENFILSYIDYPIGTSLFIVVTKSK